MSKEYWAKRQQKIQEAISKKSQTRIEKQLANYYGKAAKQVIKDFEDVLNKVLAALEDGREATPADLYKLDTYWKLQGQLRQELNKLGEKQIALLTKEFELNFFEMYYGLALDGYETFNTLNKELVQQMVNSVWCLDGKHFSQRIWKNTENLVQTLNDNLIHCVATGKKPGELVKLLQERFNVSYNRADMLVRTELAHIQTEAAKKRYQDYGIEMYEILGNDDDSCGNHSVDCHKMDGKKFYYYEMVAGKNAPPFHPNCKCSIVPVID